MPIQFLNQDAVEKALHDTFGIDDNAEKLRIPEFLAAVGLEKWAEKPYRAPRTKKTEVAATTATAPAAKK